MPNLQYKTLLIVCWAACAYGQNAADASNWNGFRGPNGGVSPWTNAPVIWDVASGQGVIWKTPLKLSGVSSPVLSGKHLYITEGDEKERAVLAFNAGDGRLLWRQVVADGGLGTLLPPVSDYGLAMPTAACDANGVYALFGTGDFVAFSPDGRLLWQHYLGRPTIGYGFASSPCVVSNLVCVQFDHHAGGRLLAVETTSGKIKWDLSRSRGASWSSLMVVPDAGGKPVIVAHANGSTTGYDLSGHAVWDVDGATGEVAPSPVWWNGCIYSINIGSKLFCHNTRANGIEKWDYTGQLSDTASPIAVNGLFFMITGCGQLTCLDAETGQELWTHKGPGCYASLVSSGDRIYAMGRDGTTLVFRAARTYQAVGQCHLNDSADATPAMTNGRIYIRGSKWLWCLGDKEESNLFGAHMQRPEIMVLSESNGVMNLTCKVGFIGGCCFPLTSHNITATLDAPQGITVINGPEPARYAAIEAPPSGTPQAWATFHWRLQQSQPSASGNTLTITVSSPGSDQVKAAYRLDQQSRIDITGPQLPDILPTGREIPITVEASSQDPDRFLKTVRFVYSTEIPPDAEKIELPRDLADRGILRFSSGGRQLMIQGQSIDLVRKYEPTIWNGTLPAQTRGPLHGVALATDDKGATAHGAFVHTAAPAGVGGVKAGGLCKWMRTAIAAFLPNCFSSTDKQAEAPGYPTNGSSVVFLFLDSSEASRQLAERMESYRRAAPHHIHLLCFVENITPAPILKAYREQLHVTKTPSAVFDAHLLVDGADTAAINGTLDRCMAKPSPKLSMELLGGVIAGSQLSLGFIMCNHAARHDAHGRVSAFAFENGMRIGDWRCDRVVRQRLIENRQYTIPMGKCQPPVMIKWDIPSGVTPAQTGALTVILDAQGNLIDSICTEHPCTRTGVCG